MAVSCADPHSRLLRTAGGLVLLFAGFCVATLAFGAGPNRANLHIEVDANFTEIDLRNNTAVLRVVTITQGDVKVRANQATATGGVDNFQDNQWVLTGDVRITLEGGALRADEAVVKFADNRLVSAVIKGSPAEFEQKLEDSEDIARGRAAQIVYDVGAETVQLQRDAFLTDGCNDITGQQLVYSIRDQRVLAEATEQSDERVHITINPKNSEPGQDRPASCSRRQ